MIFKDMLDLLREDQKLKIHRVRTIKSVSSCITVEEVRKRLKERDFNSEYLSSAIATANVTGISSWFHDRLLVHIQCEKIN